MTILGTAGIKLVCVRRAHENVGNLKSAVQFLISRVIFLFYRSKDLLEILTFECNQSAEAIKERNEDHLSLAATIEVLHGSHIGWQDNENHLHRNNICSHGKKNPLFLPSNMAAVQILYNDIQL